MANVVLEIANPSGSNVTVNSQVAVARSITNLTIADTTADVYGFLAAGCAVTSTTGSTFLQREQQGFMLEFDQ